jgi:hypothetical protein
MGLAVDDLLDVEAHRESLGAATFVMFHGRIV